MDNAVKVRVRGLIPWIFIGFAPNWVKDWRKMNISPVWKKSYFSSSNLSPGWFKRKEIWPSLLLPWVMYVLLHSVGIILCMRPANERGRYIATSPLSGWAHTQNNPCILSVEWVRSCYNTPKDSWYCGLQTHKNTTHSLPLWCSHHRGVIMGVSVVSFWGKFDSVITRLDCWRIVV